MSNSGIENAYRRIDWSMPAAYPQLKDNFPEILKKWYSIQEWLDPAITLYMAVRFASLYGPHHFLFLAQALEVFHSRNPRFDGNLEPEEVFRQRRCDIFKKLTKEERDWLKQKVYNLKHLQSRLEELVRENATETAELIPDVAEFTQTVRRARNYYTHYNPRDEKFAPLGNDLVVCNEQMLALLEICILQEIGIVGAPLTRIASRIKRIRSVSLPRLRPNPQTPNPSSPPGKQ